jgi:hypothetical protein
MKNIKLEEGEIKELSYLNIMRACINEPARDGLSVDEMRKRIRVLDKLTDGIVELELEDDDFNTLKDIVNKKRWPMPHKNIIEFVDYINSIK